MLSYIMVFEDLTPDHPKIRRIAKLTNSHKLMAYGAYVAFLQYADNQTEDGFLPLLDRDDVDDIVELPGFSAAMESKGIEWIAFRADGAHIHNYNARGGSSSKKREKCNERKRLERKAKSDPIPILPPVPEMSQQKCDIDATETRQERDQKATPIREEKRREETSSSEEESAAAPTPAPPSVSKNRKSRHERPEDVLIPEALDFPEFRALWDRWLVVRPKIPKGKGFTALAAEQHLKTLAALPRSDVIPCMEYTFGRGYLAFFPDFRKTTNGTSQRHGNGYGKTRRSDELFDPGVVHQGDPEGSQARF
jgi:hypothetical protein